MELHVIRPTYNCDNEQNEFLINGFIDEQGNKLTIEDLLNVKNDVKYYCYAYQPLIAYLQAHLNRSGYVQKKSTTASYSGRPKKQKAYFACHLVSSPNPNATPLTKQFKVFEMEKAIYFLNIDKWFTGLSIFHIPEEEVEKCFKILMKIEEILIPEYLEKGRVGRVPWTIASLGRALMSDVKRMRRPERNSFLLSIKSCYQSGYNYIAEPNKVYAEPLYYCDVKSMYSYVLLHRLYPTISLAPVYKEGFYKHNLALYHVNELKARVKPNHFPTIFSQKETQERMGLSNNTDFHWKRNNQMLGWITSIDYEMLCRDYDISTIQIDETYYYLSAKSGELIFGDKIQYYFDLKEAATDPYERQAYKGLINSYSGSIGMMLNCGYKVDSLTEPSSIIPLEDSNEDLNPWDLSAFMTAYARQYITDLALLAGYENVVCISTDAVVVKDISPLNPFIGEKMGDLSLDRVMHNTKWWRINTYEWYDGSGVWNAKIAGLPHWRYQEGKTFFITPKLLYNSKKRTYNVNYQSFNLEEDF